MCHFTVVWRLCNHRKSADSVVDYGTLYHSCQLFGAQQIRKPAFLCFKIILTVEELLKCWVI